MKKEFLLKYRCDYAGLLRYYADKKKALEEEDIAFLDEISQNADMDTGCLTRAAQKMDPLMRKKDAALVFTKLLSHVSHKEIVRIYSGMKNVSLSLVTVRTLPIEEQ